jgi:diguanylate cyclase (GGDEF)-like protein
MSEDEAESLLAALVDHRKEMAGSLGRDPGLQVAAIDYLSNVRKLLDEPTIIEHVQLELTERSAATDAVTDTYNRRYFEHAIDIEIRRARRYSLQLSLLILDLDFFKSVNDIYGHPVGDMVLAQAGLCIRRAVRDSDLACRYGGDEFAVILPETDRLGAHAVAERIRRRVKGTFSSKPIDGKLVSMTISGGLSSYPDDGVTPEVLIEKADQALYLSKSAGKDGIVIYHSERRGAVRYPTRPSARVMLAGAPPGMPNTVSAVNLSRGGALVETDMDCALAEAVELTVEEESDSWSALGYVVRVEEGAANASRRLVAVAFNDPLPARRLERSIVYSSAPRAGEGDRA